MTHADEAIGKPPARGLSGVVVLEIADTPGACFAASLFADFGATVYVCEAPPHGSRMRSLGPAGTDSLWWKVLARNKKSLALDPGTPGALPVVHALLGIADAVISDRSPLQHADCAWLASMSEVPDPPLLVEVFATGSDRPDIWRWSCRPELTAAATGMMALTGWPDQRPTQPEAPLAEYLSGTMAALQALAKLRQRHGNAGPAEAVSMPLHVAVQRMIEWQVPIATVLGKPVLRAGNDFPMNSNISNMHRTRDGHYVAVSAATQPAAERLLYMIGGEPLRDDPRYSTPQVRIANMAELYTLLDRWVGSYDLGELLAVAERHDVVLGPIYTAGDILTDEHMAARNNVIERNTSAGETIRMPGVIPQVSNVPTAITHVGPDLGEHTGEALAAAGLGAAEIVDLRTNRVIWA